MPIFGNGNYLYIIRFLTGNFISVGLWWSKFALETPVYKRKYWVDICRICIYE